MGHLEKSFWRKNAALHLNELLSPILSHAWILLFKMQDSTYGWIACTAEVFLSFIFLELIDRLYSWWRIWQWHWAIWAHNSRISSTTTLHCTAPDSSLIRHSGSKLRNLPESQIKGQRCVKILVDPLNLPSTFSWGLLWNLLRKMGRSMCQQKAVDKLFTPPAYFQVSLLALSTRCQLRQWVSHLQMLHSQKNCSLYAYRLGWM